MERLMIVMISLMFAAFFGYTIVSVIANLMGKHDAGVIDDE